MVSSFYRRAAWAVGGPFCLWTAFMLLAISPYFQRHFLYSHRVLAWWQDANEPQQWGFAKNQVTPFYLHTEDGESIHAWHVLPLPAYRQHEAALQAQPTGLCRDITTAESFRILKEDPTAQLIIYFHGNAGHLPSVVRAPSYHTFTATSNYHVLAIDYRGFGLSSGAPSEAGLVRDAAAVVDFALTAAGLPPHRVLLLGHSLGTAVATAVAERYAAVDFAGLLLVAGFSSLPDMLAGYAIAGWVPVLRPLRTWPHVLQRVLAFVVDHWRTGDRLGRLVDGVVRRGADDDNDDGPTRRRMRVSLLHAADDWDIPSHEDDKLFAAAVAPFGGGGDSAADADDDDGAKPTYTGADAFVKEWRHGGVTVRQELVPRGGHNKIVHSSPVVLEIMRAFDEARAHVAQTQGNAVP
ncbi:hypothetical protein SPI_05711 [Niveomyces insectorum RCEF 264]|uniref:Serine aminopeptidase S33 domain-containing protein n=1 Tax=Niveomyces insectorum RCEF 264 TaxID=1081102 RepID=A0A167TGS5_9HYPO|nr:hypothetical protein SPI_05711 [Niveomyces insectorum RCEF 264]